VPCSERESYFPPAAPDPATDLRLLSQVIARFQTGNFPALSPPLQEERAATLLDNYLPGGELSLNRLIDQSRAFSVWLDTFQPRAIKRQVLLTHTFNGHFFRATADWQVTLPNGNDLLIMNVHSSGKQLDQVLPVASAQLRAWSAAARAQGIANPVNLFLHLPAEGLLLRLP
jgi:hypothetical protein